VEVAEYETTRQNFDKAFERVDSREYLPATSAAADQTFDATEHGDYKLYGTTGPDDRGSNKLQGCRGWGFPWVWVWYGYGDCDESPWVLWVICGDF